MGSAQKGGERLDQRGYPETHFTSGWPPWSKMIPYFLERVLRLFYFFAPAIFMMGVCVSAQEVTAIPAHPPDASSAAICPKSIVLGPPPSTIHEIPPSLTSDHYVHQIPSGSCNRDCVRELPQLPDNNRPLVGPWTSPSIAPSH